MYRNQIFMKISEELSSADEKHPAMKSEVEGLHTLKCEVAELEREVMRGMSTTGLDRAAMKDEAVQVGAMAVKFIRDCCMD